MASAIAAPVLTAAVCAFRARSFVGLGAVIIGLLLALLATYIWALQLPALEKYCRRGGCGGLTDGALNAVPSIAAFCIWTCALSLLVAVYRLRDAQQTYETEVRWVATLLAFAPVAAIFVF